MTWLWLTQPAVSDPGSELWQQWVPDEPCELQFTPLQYEGYTALEGALQLGPAWTSMFSVSASPGQY